MVFRQIIIVLVFQEILLFKEVNISSWTTRPLSIGIAILPYIICLEECRLYNFLKNKCRASFVSMLMVDMSTVDSTENIKEIHRFYLFILFFFTFHFDCGWSWRWSCENWLNLLLKRVAFSNCANCFEDISFSVHQQMIALELISELDTVFIAIFKLSFNELS